MKKIKKPIMMPCPYELKVTSIERYKNSYQKDEIIEGWCPDCKYHVKRIDEDYILCKNYNFNDKLKIVKNLIR